MSKDPDEQEPAAGEKKRRYWLATAKRARRKSQKVAAPDEPQRLHVVSGHNFRAKPKPEPQEPNYTGRYESPWSDLEKVFKEPAWVLLINQASTAVEGVIVEVLWGKTWPRRSWRFSGTLQGHDVIVVGKEKVPPGTAKVTGQIAADGNDLMVTLNLPDLPGSGRAAKPRSPVGVTFSLVLDGARPSYFGDALKAMFGNNPLPSKPAQIAIEKEDRELILYAETHPLHTFQIDLLWVMLMNGREGEQSPPLLERLIRSALLGHAWTPEDDTDSARMKRKLIPSGSDFADDVNKTNAVNKLDEHVRDAFLSALPDFRHSQGTPLFNHGDLPLLRYHARLILAHHTCPGNDGSKRTLLQWIEALAAHARTSTRQEAPLPAIAECLGVTVATDGKPFAEYKYELTFNFNTEKSKEIKKRVEDAKKGVEKAGKKLPAIPKGAVVDWAFGTLVVKYIGGSKRDWEQSYEVKYFGFGPGFGGPGDLSTKTTMTSYEEWTRKDFPGGFKIFDGAAYVKAKPSDALKLLPGNEKLKKELAKPIDKLGKDLPMPGAGDRGMALELTGAGNHRRVSMELAGAEKVRSGFGLYFFVAFGWISEVQELEHMDFSRIPDQEDLDLQQEAREQWQFNLNWATLEDSGRALLRRFCARELPWLMNPDSALTVTGHCDRIASADYNQKLSENRAHNVTQTLKDVLGKNLKVKEVDVKGFGKQEAERAFRESGGKEPLINRGRRRVDVVLNGRGVLSLWGQEDKE